MLRDTARLLLVALAATALGVGAAPAYAVVPPDTTITSGPDPDLNNNYVLPGPVTFTFTSDQVGTTFECAIDSDQLAAYQPCTSPASYDLPFGTHYFRVRAVNGPLKDASPAVRWWYVRNVPCEQAGDAYQAAQGSYFEWQSKLSRAKQKLRHARAHGTATQVKHAEKKVKKAKKNVRKYKAAMDAATAQSAAVCGRYAVARRSAP